MHLLFVLLIPVCLWGLALSLRRSRGGVRAWEADPEVTALVHAHDRADRRARLRAPWRAPWPWWFLGACLAFAGLCLGGGLWQWHTADAPVLLLGGLVFGLAAAFKAWAQAPAPLRARVRRRWHSRTRA